MTSYTFSAGTEKDITIGPAGTYFFQLYGAQGGSGGNNGVGGDGAAVGGDIFLTAGTKLELVVGAAGGSSPFDGGGGGGASFLIDLTTHALLAVAGGGGGGGHGGGAGGGGIGNAETGGDGGAAGVGGQPGQAGAGGGFDGGGGGGFTGGGGAFPGGYAGTGATSEVAFKGGIKGAPSAGSGGLGGGGGGGYFGGGGGGGYGGGGGGSTGGGGGGGSYLAPTFTSRIQSTQATHAGGGEIVASVCYAAGTRILAERGEVEVEALRIGERIVTASGALRPIRWIGTRSYSQRFARNNVRELAPVCIQAAALGENVPARDLYVSPRHAMSLDGVLIEARHLVNGATVTQPLPHDDVRYFHIELDSHDVLIAEGAAAESYLDDDNRAIFHNAASYDGKHLGGAYCAPRVDSGEAFERVRNRLEARRRAVKRRAL